VLRVYGTRSGVSSAARAPQVAARLTKKRRHPRLRGLIVFVLVVPGLTATVFGGRALWRQLTGPATPAQLAETARADMAARWSKLTAGQIFPADVSYLTPAGTKATAHRVGIAPWAPCAAAMNPLAAGPLRRHGCIAVLRATYADASGTLLVTAGIAVLPSTSAARAALRASGANGSSAQVRPVAFPGTVADLFGGTQRDVFAVEQAGPALVLAAMGSANGEYDPASAAGPALLDLGAALIHTLAGRASRTGACPAGGSRC
jgi:hypothetical protein